MVTQRGISSTGAQIMDTFKVARMIIYIMVASLFIMIQIIALAQQNGWLTVGSLLLFGFFTGVVMWLEMNFGGH